MSVPNDQKTDESSPFSKDHARNALFAKSDSDDYQNIEPGWKSYLYQVQLRAPPPKKVICKQQMLGKPEFYGEEFHGSISRSEADVLVSGADGLYLTRESQNKPGTYALTFCFGGGARNYRLYYDHEEGTHFVGEKRFESVYDLVADGLITMFVEASAKDYIDHMSFDVIDSPPCEPLRNQSIADKEFENAGSWNVGETKRKSMKPLEIAKEHNFKVNNFYGPHWCDYCKNFMWGLKAQGVKCQDCGYNSHKQCGERVPANCIPDKKLVKRVFGVDLTTLIKAYGLKRPPVVDACISEIEKRGVSTEGIYRVSGFADDVERLKNDIDKDGAIPCLGPEVYGDINVIAGLLKLYFRSLPIPLITFETYGDFIAASKIEDDMKCKAALHAALMKLPPAHYETLKYCMRHLYRVVKYKDKNLMTTQNLGVVFGPTLMRAPDSEILAAVHDLPSQRKVAEILIGEQDILFAN
eukprot:gene3159-3628_t